MTILRAMALGHIFLRSLANPRVALPLAGGVLILVSWWGIAASHLARQIDRHDPTPMRFEEAVAASKDGEIYVRINDARLDCDKGLTGSFGNAFALLEHQGRVAAMIPLPNCDASKTPLVDGIFRHPPYLLYGAAVERGWNVTPGHLAFLDPKVQSADPWLRVALSVLIGLLTIASALSSIAAGRSLNDERAWHVRAVGFAVMAMAPWLAYVEYDYVFFGVVPVPLVAAIAAALGLAMVMVPRHAYIQKVTARFLGNNPAARLPS